MFSWIALIFLLSPSVHAGAHLSPYMQDLLAHGVQLRNAPSRIAPSGTVGVIRQAEGGATLGSYTRICMAGVAKADPTSVYYLTNYHVTLAARSVLTENGERLKLEFADSAMDMALYSLSSSARPCATLATQLRMPMIFDADAAGNVSLHNLVIEAYSTETGGIEARQMSTVLGSSPYSGLPGYFATGPALSANARSLKGMSGGALFGQVFNDKVETTGHELNASVDMQTGRVSRSQTLLLGLIQGIDSEGRRTVAISAPYLWQRVLLYFADRAKFGDFLISSIDNGGVYYPLLNAHYYRGSASPHGKYQDSSIAGTGNAGTGRGTDGGGSVVDSKRSGLVFADQPERTWLSLKNLWAEYETFDPRALGAEIVKANRDGIFEQNVALFTSSAGTIIPEFFWHDWSVVRLAYDFSNLTEQLLATSNGPLKDYRVFAALGRVKGGEKTQGATVFTWDHGTATGRAFTLSVFPFARDASGFSIVVNLTKCASPLLSPCPLEVIARLVRHGNPYGAWEGQNSILWYSHWQENLSALPHESLVRQGLRHFYSAAADVTFERFGGFRMENQGVVYTGPVGEAITYLDPDLGDARQVALRVRAALGR